MAPRTEVPWAEDALSMPTPPELPPTAAADAPGKVEQPIKNDLQHLLVVLDLDHTLLCARDSPSQGFDFCLARGSRRAWVWKRPGLDAFLDWLRHPGLEVAAYTAGSSDYAQEIIAHLDPEGTLFRRRLSRGDCVLEPPAKDLQRLEHDLRRTVLVDDSLTSFRLQPENGLPVGAFQHTDRSDCELRYVQMFLENLLALEDVREVLRAAFNLRERIGSNVIQSKTDMAQTLQAVHVTGAGMAKVNGRYVLAHEATKCGRPLYVHEEHQSLRILWSGRGNSWVIDDAEVKEYRYVATGWVDGDVPLGTEWSSCRDSRPEPGLLVTEACRHESDRGVTRSPGAVVCCAARLGPGGNRVCHCQIMAPLPSSEEWCSVGPARAASAASGGA